MERWQWSKYHTKLYGTEREFWDLAPGQFYAWGFDPISPGEAWSRPIRTRNTRQKYRAMLFEYPCPTNPLAPSIYTLYLMVNDGRHRVKVVQQWGPAPLATVEDAFNALRVASLLSTGGEDPYTIDGM